jgi:hypothetical protein
MVVLVGKYWWKHYDDVFIICKKERWVEVEKWIQQSDGVINIY